MRHRPTLFIAALLSVTLFAPLPIAAEDGRVPVSKSTVEQKQLLVENMVTRSIAAKTISQSQDREAIAALSKAKSLIEDAKTAGAGGLYKKADDLLNEALKLVNDQARRLTLDTADAERAKTLFQLKRRAVETFLSAYQRVAASPTADSSQQSKSNAVWISAKLAEADATFKMGQTDKAQELLETAYERARELIRTMRAGQTLTRSLNFATAEEEYEYEIKRNDSFFALLEFAIVEKKPVGSIVERIHGNREKARAVRNTAEAMAKKGEHPHAITELNESTTILLQSIRMSGVFVPE